MEENNSKARAHVFISGIVHGVFFRASTRDMAKIHDLAGWVRNCPDGKVEAVFEGNKKDILSVIDWCGKGPSAAHVTDVEVSWEQANGKLNSFTIEY